MLYYHLRVNIKPKTNFCRLLYLHIQYCREKLAVVHFFYKLCHTGREVHCRSNFLLPSIVHHELSFLVSYNLLKMLKIVCSLGWQATSTYLHHGPEEEGLGDQARLQHRQSPQRLGRHHHRQRHRRPFNSLHSG